MITSILTDINHNSNTLTIEDRGLNLREYQKELAETATQGRNTIIHAATGAGKTRIAFYIVKKHLENHPDGRMKMGLLN